jgi:phosphoglycerate dehydrogenase-like enzyme
MVKVGVPAWVSENLLAKFSRDVEIVRIEAKPERTIEVEFWIAPAYPKEAAQVAPHLSGIRVAQSLLAGVDWLQRLIPPEVTLCDARGLHNIPTAEWVISAILAALKYFPFYVDLERAGDWRRRSEVDEQYRAMHGIEGKIVPPVLQEELFGKRVMIVGYGSIGRSIEERLTPFGVEIVRVARQARAGESVASIDRLLDLLPDADVVVLIVPLTPETAEMIGERELARMKRGALLVNAARGPVVKTDALLAALESRRIRAVVDVTDPEPLPEGHPMWTAPNLFITPHVAASSPMFVPRAIEFATEQVRRYVKGEPLENIVTGHY